LTNIKKYDKINNLEIKGEIAIIVME